MPWSVLYLLDVFAILLFLLSYYFNCYRQGYRIDFWHVNLITLCVLPNLIMLPFARSNLNGIVLGQDLGAVQAVLPVVFEITLVGYFSIFIGGLLWHIHLGLGIRRGVIPLLDVPPRLSRMLMSSQSLLVFQSMICLSLQVLVLGFYFAHSGFGFDLRTYTFANPRLRPVALLASNYSMIIAAACLARYVDTKEKILLACTLLLSFGLVFFGSRSSILAIYMGILVCFLVKLRTRVKLLRLFFFASLLIVAVLYLGDIRSGQYSLGEFLGTLLFFLLFGNTFSDLRDFAWVYSGWNHQYWFGKTYFAALISFIPRFASGFRDQWSLGAATALTVGFDPAVHPGLRPGIFGEGYFNFGLFGVVCVGLMLGVALRRVDLDVKRAFAYPNGSMVKALASTSLLGVVGNFAISAGFSGFYIVVGVWIFSWFCLELMKLVQPHPAMLTNPG